MRRPLHLAMAAPAGAQGRPAWEDGAAADILDALNGFYREILALPDQASTIARRIDALHFVEITTMFAVAGLIAVVVLIFLIRYHRTGPVRPTPRIEPHHSFELSLYAGLFTLFILFWVIGFRQYVVLGVPPEDTVDIYVTSKQWMWKFTYPEGPASVAVLYVPVGRPVRLLLTSRDVIHSLFVPAFRIKRDAVPGLYTTAWFEVESPGRYPIYCTELCGVGHSEMRAEVVALRPEEFDAWVQGRAPAVAAGQGREAPYLTEPTALEPLVRLSALGEAVAARHGCLSCHTLDGSPGIGPTWVDLYGYVETLEGGERVLVDEAYITESIMDPQARIVAGYPPVMPSFLGRITPAEIAAIIELMKSLASAPGLRPVRGRSGAAGPGAEDVRR